MKTLKITLLTAFLLCLTVSTFGQRRFSGRVVDVPDGRTASVEMSGGGRLTVRLQFVEVPEIGQPLHDTVRDHLKKLLLGQNVLVNPTGINGSETIGQIFLNDVDISQQLLRDGAAWYALPEKSGQDSAESAIYERLEADAKKEKRGIWSIQGIQPAWEFRASRDAELKIRTEEEAQKRIQEARARGEYN